MHAYTHTHTHINPWIHKFVMARVGCGISHKDPENTDKCSNNKTKATQKQNEIKGKNTFKVL